MRRSAERALRTLLAALSLCAGCLPLYLVLARGIELGRFATPHSTYGAGSRGARALFELSERLGHPPERWVQDLSRLPPRAMLLALGDCTSDLARPLSRYELAELSNWVAAGGHLLVAGARGYLPELFGVRFGPEPGCSAPAPSADDAEWITPREARSREARSREARSREARSSEARSSEATSSEATSDEADPWDHEPLWAAHGRAGEALAGIDDFRVSDVGQLQVRKDSEAIVLATLDDDGRPLAVALPHGRGRVIVFATASLFENASLSEAEGGVAFARLLDALTPGMPVLFDEYHLGVGERRSAVRYLRSRGATPLFVALGLLFALAVRRAWVRVQPVATALPEPPTIGRSFVAALGTLYARSRDRAGAIASVAEHGYGRIARHHHLGRLSGPALAARLRARGLVEEAAAVEDIAATVAAPPASVRAACARIDAALLRAGVTADGDRTIGYRRATT